MRFYNNIELSRYALIGLWLVLAAVALPASAQAHPADSAVKNVVIQVSSGDKKTQKVALNNAVHLQQAMGKDRVHIEVVAYGPGLKLLTSQSQYSDRVADLVHRNIRLSACHNTIMAIQDKTGQRPDLLDGVQIVPSGIARIVELENAGYAYVRP